MWEHVLSPLTIRAKERNLFRVLKEHSHVPMSTFTDVWSKPQGLKCFQSHLRFQNTEVRAEAESAEAHK